MSNMLSNSVRSADSEVIPFFHDLPKPAISSAARLWDEAQSASYNGQTAYQDFAQDLRFLHIEPPPRAIVKRWIAGVQANLIPRPGGEGPNAAISVPVASTAQQEKRWESQNDRRHRRATAQEKLAAALPEFQPSSVKAKAEFAVHAVDAMVAVPESAGPVRPSIVPEIDPETRGISVLAMITEIPASSDFDTLAAQLYAATLAEIRRDAEAKAAKLVASRLREIADRYDASAA
ncbi:MULTISPECIES: hypothetical protein [Agrobacterium]|uniref:Uncharacterized protein n=1 Tax=Agrobacterium fabrum TaxID=1176649 RepID=A0A2W5EPI9_9HYPH|nr:MULTISPECIES: hypothetical protein [Agrobacterium]PZP45975.1 MAG: hypothetical protein DI595_18310 [Agrobacterium fabrum]QCL76078.1 hypothetical protein CFBP5499_21800 [Agrobacterium tumefaciens]CUX69224.1 conserved hypothetical protein [Agrobacterium sp. NCPPB 925]